MIIIIINYVKIKLPSSWPHAAGSEMVFQGENGKHFKEGMAKKKGCLFRLNFVSLLINYPKSIVKAFKAISSFMCPWDN